ncbi:hypothetical protein FRX31_025675 [Thalictrum thalictroides]|uniref:Uncharacterized protein n=1 Tax=Thalictrum thalictroides TaxID=46969 RepID=A0A7J6VHZ8_THATH|nr:hypothetical protein FRX31_025675 [Thalictrum thalictroides]
MGDDVIMLAESGSVMISLTICLVTLDLLDFKEDSRCQTLIVTDSIDSDAEVGKDMAQLGRHLGVRVHVHDVPDDSRDPWHDDAGDEIKEAPKP